MSEEQRQTYRAPQMETKTVQIYPSEYQERNTIELYEKCGWSTVSSTRHQERHGDTTSTFIRITFQRDKNMPNYEKIRKLSDLATSWANTSPKKSRKVKASIWMLVLGLTCAGYAVAAFISMFKGTISPVGVILTIIAVAFIVSGILLLKAGIKKNKEFEESYYRGKKCADEAASECESLMRNN